MLGRVGYRHEEPSEMKSLADNTDPLHLESLETPIPHLSSVQESIKRLAAGGLAGLVAKSVVAPVDRMKILFQVTSGRFSLNRLLVLIKDISREEGPKGFFKGNSATMIRVFPYAGVQFFTFDSLKNMSLRRTAKNCLGPLEGFVFGSIAGAVSVLITYPLDLARARLAVNVTQRHGAIVPRKQPTGPLGVLVQIVRVDGLSATYRGILPTLFGIVPYAGIAFCLNDSCKIKVHTVLKRKPTTGDMLIIGGLAGLAAQSCTYPLEVLRRRMQTSGSINQHRTAHGLFTSNSDVRIRPVTNNAALHPTMGEILRRILEEQGVRGLFKGLSMNWVKAPISISISFTAFDLFKDMLNV